MAFFPHWCWIFNDWQTATQCGLDETSFCSLHLSIPSLFPDGVWECVLGSRQTGTRWEMQYIQWTHYDRLQTTTKHLDSRWELQKQGDVDVSVSVWIEQQAFHFTFVPFFCLRRMRDKIHVSWICQEKWSVWCLLLFFPFFHALHCCPVCSRTVGKQWFSGFWLFILLFVEFSQVCSIR